MSSESPQNQFDLDFNFEQNQLTQELEENGNIQLEDNDEQDIKNDDEKNQMQDSNVNNKGNEINNNQNNQQNSQNNLVPYKYIGNYSFSLQDVIGSGFSSNVYLGKNVNTSETVAIKVIETKKIQNEVHKYLLDTELQVLQKIESPYIVNVKNIYQTSNNTYIIMEFCNNGDLDKQIRMKTKIPENIAAKYLRQIVIGFQELVKKRVVHRDLKPANIMLKDETAKIADFGFSEFIDSPPFKIFYNVGSPNYMAPQALRNNRYSFKSDVWSIGALYYELLTGNTPYNAPTEEKLLFYAENIPVKFPKNVLISEESKQFIKRCMTVNEDKRIAPEEMLDHPLLRKVEREIQDSLQNRQKNKKSISFHGQDLQSNKNKLSSLINSGNNKSQQNLNLQHMQQSAHAFSQGQQQQLEYNYSQKNNIRKILNLNQQQQLSQQKSSSNKNNQNQQELLNSGEQYSYNQKHINMQNDNGEEIKITQFQQNQKNDKIQLESSWITEAIELQKMLDSGILEYVKEKQNSVLNKQQQTQIQQQQTQENQQQIQKQNSIQKQKSQQQLQFKSNQGEYEYRNGRQRENSIPSKNLQEEKNEQSMNTERINIQLNSSNQKQDQKIIINEQNSRQIYSGKKQQENQPSILSIQNANLPQSKASNTFNNNFYKENQQYQHQQYHQNQNSQKQQKQQTQVQQQQQQFQQKQQNLPKLSQQQSHQQLQNEQNNNDFIILSQINYCRFLFRLAKQSHENVPLISVNTRDKLIFLLLKNIMIKMNKMIELTYPLKPQQRQQNYVQSNQENQNVSNSEINSNMNNTSFLSNKNMNFSNNKNQDSNNINNSSYNQEKFAVNHYKLDNFENYLASESYKKFKDVIQEYYTKYNKSFKSCSDNLKLNEDFNQGTSIQNQSLFEQNLEENKEFYIQFKEILRMSIREMNHILRIKLKTIDNLNDVLDNNLSDQITLLDLFSTLYQYCNMFSQNYEEYQQFALTSKISLIADYKSSKLSKFQYNQVRQKIKALEI